ncbi:MAG: hypothetical protein R3266_05435 [Gemmatimonadota bacterium]|nr:hypothetical protein [Gemmatimonadota bacterium]
MTTVNRVPEVVEALATAIERGHHLAVCAAEGGGLSALYARAILHDLSGGDEAGRAFVLTATPDRAQRCARAMAPLLVGAGIEPLALSRGARGPSEIEEIARVIVGTPSALLERVRAGRLSAAALRTIALDDVAALREARPAVDALLQAADEARRIAAGSVVDEAFQTLIERQLPRARRWPPELFDGEGTEVEAGDPGLAVAWSAGRAGRLARLAEELHRLAADPSLETVSVLTAEDEAAVDVEIALAVEGFRLADPGSRACASCRRPSWSRTSRERPSSSSFRCPPRPSPPRGGPSIGSRSSTRFTPASSRSSRAVPDGRRAPPETPSPRS